MVSSPRLPPHGLLGRAAGWVRSMVRSQFITGNRRFAFLLAVVTAAIAVAAVHVSVWWFSPGVMILPILAGGLLLWRRALRLRFGVVGAAVISDTVKARAGACIIATI